MSEILEIINFEVSSSSKAKDGFKLIHSLEAEQMLLPETAHFLATQTYFKMLNIPYSLLPRLNVEFMSINGGKTGLPLLLHGGNFISEFIDIVNYVERQEMTPEKENKTMEQHDLEAELLKIDTIFLNAELYFCWVDEQIYSNITSKRYGFPFKWPLNVLQCWQKRQTVKKILDLDEWLEDSFEEVFDKLDSLCISLNEKLDGKKWFNGEHATKLDALVFGHLFAITTTNLNNSVLSNLIKNKSNLIQFCKMIEDTFFTRRDIILEGINK